MSVLAANILLSILYIFWNWKIKDRPLVLPVSQDREAFNVDKISSKSVRREVSSALLSVISSLTGLTFAGTFVVLALVVFDVDMVDALAAFKRVVLFIVLGLIAVAAICWLLALQALTTMARPSIEDERMFKLYVYVTILWLVGMLFIVDSLVLFLLIVNPILAMVAGVAALVVAVVYWNIAFDWSLPLPKKKPPPSG